MNRNITRWIGIVCAALAMIMLWVPWIKPLGDLISSSLIDGLDSLLGFANFFMDDDIGMSVKQVRKAASCLQDLKVSPAELVTICRGLKYLASEMDFGTGARIFMFLYPLLFLLSLGLSAYTLVYRFLERRNLLDWACFITRILIFLILFVLMLCSKSMLSDLGDTLYVPITIGIRITLWSVLAVLLSAPMDLLSRIPIPAGFDRFDGIHSANALVNNIAGALSGPVGMIKGFAVNGWRCEKCGKSNQNEYGFCQRCGTKKPLPPRCPECGRELKGNSPYCGFCGKQIRQPERQSRCPRCGRSIPNGVPFCGHCGTPTTRNGGGVQPRLCPRCRKPLHPGAPFCGNCGYRGR